MIQWPYSHLARDGFAMPHRDFEIDTLAKYLHLPADRILKLAERGKLPGRRVGGAWKFPRAEIHHWLEERLGAGGDEELAHVEQVLDRSQETAEEITIAGLMSPEAIALPLAARTRSSVISAMMELASSTGWLWDAPRMEEAVRARENLHSTALEIGAALLHPRRPLPEILGQSFIAFGRTGSGIPFGGERGMATDLFFLLCSLDEAIHLRVLARLSRLLLHSEFLDLLRSADSGEELIRGIADCESRVFPA